MALRMALDNSLNTLLSNSHSIYLKMSLRSSLSNSLRMCINMPLVSRSLLNLLRMSPSIETLELGPALRFQLTSVVAHVAC
jgi:hypothetical protein